MSEATREILQQHDELRARLHGLMAAVERWPLPGAGDALRAALLRLAARLETHLQLEERELAPRLRVVDAWGPEREAALHAEHRAQRARLERACAAIDDPEAAPADVADEIWVLVGDLLEDMLREERALVELAELELGHVDQLTG